MTGDAQEMFDLFVERIKQAHDIAVMIATIVSTQRNLLMELAHWHDANYLAQDVMDAEELARKGLELWDQFWNISGVEP